MEGECGDDEALECEGEAEGPEGKGLGGFGTGEFMVYVV